MHPIYIIARREFLQRVRQKSFWIMLLLGPFFLMVIMIVPIGLAMEKENSAEILYLDQSGELDTHLYSEPDLILIKAEGTAKQCFEKAKMGGYAGLVRISRSNKNWQISYYQTGLSGQNPALFKALLQNRIAEYEISHRQNLEMPNVSFRMASAGEITKGEPDRTFGFVIGLFTAVLVLIFINQYSHMVLRGVVEEKQNRISELILTSVRPVYFISGKIIGIASAAFLQIFVWAVLSVTSTLSIHQYFKLDRFSNQHLEETLKSVKDIPQTLEMNAVLNSVSSVNGVVLLGGFIFYFVFGYLLYSSLFAVIGISAGSDTDAQQLAIPFTLPLAVPVILLQYIAENQESGITKFLSVFPFTSPTAMLLRLPYGVPLQESLLSACVLLCTLFLAAFLGAKIYRTGIFMHGKKFTITEVIKMARLS